LFYVNAFPSIVYILPPTLVGADLKDSQRKHFSQLHNPFHLPSIRTSASFYAQSHRSTQLI